MPIMKKTLQLTTEAGFPTKVYVGMVGWLAGKGYDVSKVKDWLEVNPKTAYHQDVMQRRQALEQSLGRVMQNISELRKDVEMIKHDLRKFEQVSNHCDLGKDEILKADFIDLVDDPQRPNSLIQLQAKGRFPSIVIDFMRAKSKDEIKKMKISNSEKNILEIKLDLYNEWKSEYCKAVKDRLAILREEYNSRAASLENYKSSIQPYLQALGKIKISEGHYKGLTDPLLIEGYSTSIAGVELVAWRGMEAQEKWLLPDEKFTHYILFNIKIRRDTIVLQGKEVEVMKIEIESDLSDADSIKKKKEEIKKVESALADELKEFKGEMEVPKKETPKKDERDKFTKIFNAAMKKGSDMAKSLSGIKPAGKLPKGYGDALKETVEKETIELYDTIKLFVGGMPLKHPRV